MQSVHSSELERQYTFFHHAAAGDLCSLRALLDSGISINITDYNGRSALHLAFERGHTEMVNYLLEQGADKDLKDIFGNTPVNMAQKGKQPRHYSNATHQPKAHTHACAEDRSRKQADRKQAERRRLMLARFDILDKFPRPVARALLEGRNVPPMCRDLATVAFIEVVGFSDLKAALPLPVLSRALARLHRALDTLAYVHGVQRVDVLGEVYLAATNFSDPQPADHAARMARFALAALRAAAAGTSTAAGPTYDAADSVPLSRP